MPMLNIQKQTPKTQGLNTCVGFHMFSTPVAEEKSSHGQRFLSFLRYRLGASPWVSSLHPPWDFGKDGIYRWDLR